MFWNEATLRARQKYRLARKKGESMADIGKNCTGCPVYKFEPTAKKKPVEEGPTTDVDGVTITSAPIKQQPHMPNTDAWLSFVTGRDI